MTPRNPDENSEEHMQKQVLQAIHDALNLETAADPAPQGAPALSASQEVTPETKVELDRVEIYLKGPTAFTA